MEHHRAVQAARVAAWKVSSGSRKEKRVWPEAEPDIMEEPPERRSCITIRMTAIEMLLIHQHSEIGNIFMWGSNCFDSSGTNSYQYNGHTTSTDDDEWSRAIVRVGWARNGNYPKEQMWNVSGYRGFPPMAIRH